MNDAVWFRIERITVSLAQLSRVMNYRHSKYVSRRRLRKLFGSRYMRNILTRFDKYTDEDILAMKYILHVELDFMLDKETIKY